MRNVFQSLSLSLALLVAGCGGISWTEEVPKNEPFPVSITSCDGAMGSGALVGNYVYTAYHVVDNCVLAKVTSEANNSFGGLAVVEDYNEEWDVARLLFVDVTGPGVPIANPKVGNVCTHNSVPEDEKKCGHIIAIEDTRWGLYLDFKVIPGNSGSPIYQDGKLVGVVTARFPYRGSSIKLNETE